MAEKLYTTRDLSYWYGRGVQDERERAAAAGLEHELFWDRSADQIMFDRKAELMRLFRRNAEELAIRMGRKGYRPYNGGPVDFETGRPVRYMAVAA